MATATEVTFHECVDKILKSWTALVLAVEQGFGGKDSTEKGEWLVGATVQWFSENGSLDIDDIKEFLSDFCEEELATEVDDGSLPQIATYICKCHSLLSESKYLEVRSLLSKLQPAQASNSVSKDDEYTSSGSEDNDTSEHTSMELSPDPMRSCNGHGGSDAAQSNAGGDASASNNQMDLAMSKSQTSNVMTLDIPLLKPETDEEKMEDDGWTVVKKGKKR